MTLGSTPPQPSLPESAPESAAATSVHTPTVGSKRWVRVLGKGLLWGGVISTILFALLVLATRFIFWPQASAAKSWLETTVSQKLNRTVTIQKFETYWEGFHPAFRADGITLKTKEQQVGLTIAHAEGSIAWESLGRMGLYFHRFDAQKTFLQIERNAQGQLFVASLPISTKPGDGSFEDWLLNQDKITLHDSQIDWRDAFAVPHHPDLARPITTTANLPLLSMENDAFQHNISAQANIARVTSAPIAVSTTFRHGYFHQPNVWRAWQGQLTWSIPDAQLVAVQDLYPYAEQVTRGAVQTEGKLSFDQGQVTHAQTALALKDVQLKFGAANTPLHVYALHGVFEQHLAGDKHAVTVNHLDWQAENNQSALQNIKQLTVAWRPAPELTSLEGLPRWMSLQAPVLELDALNQLAQTLPLPIKISRTLNTLNPHGKLEEVSGTWEPAITGQRADLNIAEKFNAKMRLRNVSLNPLEQAGDKANSGFVIPGFKNVSGKIDAQQDTGTFQIDSIQSALIFPGIFDAPQITLDSLRGIVEWQKQKGIWEVRSTRLDVKNSDITAHAKVRYQFTGKGPGSMDLDAIVQHAQITQIPRYLPTRLSPSLRQYLQGALKGGTAKDATVSLHGDLAQFPYQTTGAAKPTGTFHIEVPVRQLVYQPANTPPKPWPNIEQADGTVIFDKTSLQFKVAQATSMGVKLQNVVGGIDNMAAPDANLKLEGVAQGETQGFLRYVNESPVGGWLGNFTQDSQAKGLGKLALKLTLPLGAQSRPAQVQGLYEFQNSTVQLMPLLPPFSGLVGGLQFTEKGVQLQNLHGRFLGGEVRTEGGTQADGAIKIIARGTATVQGVKEAYAQSALERVAMRLEGSTPYQATISVQHGRPDVTVQTDMKGLAIDLPYPLNKSAEVATPTRFTWRVLNSTAPVINALQATNDAATTHTVPQPPKEKRPLEEIIVQYGAVLGARYTQQREQNNGTSLTTVLNGGIGINRPIPVMENGVLANIDLDELNIDAWRAALNQITGRASAKPPVQVAPVPTVTQASDTTATTAVIQPASDTAKLVANYLPSYIAAQTKSLTVVGRTVQNVVVGASRDGQNWQANVDSPQVSGYLRWRPEGVEVPFGELSAKLARLNIPARQDIASVTSLLEDKAQEIPGFDIQADELTFEGKPLGRFTAKAHSNSSEQGSEWELENLTLQNAGGKLTATGSWKVRARLQRPAQQTLANSPTSNASTSATPVVEWAANKNTALRFDLQISDAGKLLDILGMPKTLAHGEGALVGRINWQGSPMELSYGALNGHMQLNLNKGQFLKVDPGAAKLLGVLSFQGLSSLATFDFRGLFGEGTPFNTIKATGDLDKGVFSTEDFEMHSSQANVFMRGSADIPHETQSMHVTVFPNVSAASASLAITAINPVVGLGTLVAQYLLKEQISNALKMEYDVSGSWSHPTVEKK